jgi:magnesium transporter
VLLAMDTQDRQRVEKILPYDEDTAGGLMNTDNITTRPDLSLDVVLRYLRRHTSCPISSTLFLSLTARISSLAYYRLANSCLATQR